MAVSSSEEEEPLLISISSFACIKNKNTTLKGLKECQIQIDIIKDNSQFDVS